MRVLGLLAVVAGSVGGLLVGGQTTTSACSVDDRTYSNETMPAGSYQPHDKLNPVVGALSTKFYITVVNLTPHRFRLDGAHSYQMPTFDFGDVPQGRSRQNTVKYRGTWATKDDAGEAYYRVDGTDKTFALRVKSHVPDAHPRRVVLDLSGMRLGQREYVFPGAETGVSLVITGSERFGFQASLTHGPGNWMRNMYDVIRNRLVRHLVLPGTHDSGMSRISNRMVSLGSAANTQTQGINVHDQLRAGARWFDLRIGSIHPNGNAAQNDGFWTMHLNDEMAGIAVGNTGEPLDDVIREVNRFTSDSPGELIFLAVRYLVGRYEVPDGGPILWDAALVNDFFARLRGLNNRCPNLDTSTGFQNQKASYFLDKNGGHGCVIVLLDGQLRGDGMPRESVGDGIYDMGRVGIQDRWSNMEYADGMGPDQVRAWRGVARRAPSDHADGGGGPLLIAQWLVTPSALASTAYTLQGFAVEQSNPSLYWAGVDGMDPEHWPNVLLVDYVGVQQQGRWAWDQLSAELYALAVGLNLYMVSENCGVNAQQSPLLRRSGCSSSVGGVERRRDVQWNGIIFANGTRIDDPPSTLHPGRVGLLRNGTVFGNGTALENSVPNPWW